MILKYDDIFRQDTLNIFTDASIKQVANETLGCPGAVIVVTNENNENVIIEESSYIIRHSTNNNSEISAIQYGIMYALKYRDSFKTINLFSDSNICVQGLTDWIFNWVNCVHNGQMYSSSGKPVANQDIFISIIHTIVNNNLIINIYHQKGHVVINSQASLNKAKNSMIKTNKVKDIEMKLVYNLSIFNDRVDKITKWHLDEYVKTYVYREKYNNIFKAVPHISNDTISKYKMLIGE